jgi:hypothetical protein
MIGTERMQKQMYNPIWHIPAMFVPDRFLQRSGFRERNPQKHEHSCWQTEK